MSFKKCKFYTMMINREKMKIEAVQKEGFTDGEFFYYKETYSNNITKWFCIEPTTGCAVCSDCNTRKEAYNKKEELREQIKSKDKTELINKFNKLLEAV